MSLELNHLRKEVKAGGDVPYKLKDSPHHGGCPRDGKERRRDHCHRDLLQAGTLVFSFLHLSAWCCARCVVEVQSMFLKQSKVE